MKQFLLLIFILSAYCSYAGGVRGVVRNEKGEPLPYATIYVKETGSGTTTNDQAYYEINLEPGNYQLIFQFVGYASLTKEVIVEDGFVELDVKLESQVIMLKDIEVRAGKEDPAYTIMRKAIAKSKFHTQQVDKYTAKVYMKGTGKLKDYPFLMKGQIKKAGIDPDRVFITESVSEVEYIRPNTYNEKVISIYTTGDNRNTMPNAYINGSFYEPELAKCVSPLSPKAFSYYKFRYEGTYQDQGVEISKIRVIPRSKGDNVFRGTINIVEDYWSIYSLDLHVTKFGVDFHIKQVYKPIEEGVWLPVTHKFHVEGKVLGFEFEGDYLATVSNYDVETNPDLDMEIEVIDEKVEEELAEELEDQVQDEDEKEIQEILTSGKEVTRKQLKKVLKAYEKDELRETDNVDIISNRTFEIDSNAYSHDSLYWAQIRPVPLNRGEKRGYDILDSLNQVREREENGDTLRNTKRKGFHVQDLLVGNSYDVGDKAYLKIRSPFLGFNYNTVEGFNLDYKLTYSKTFSKKSWLSISPLLRYAFSRKKVSGTLKTHYGFGENDSRNNLTVTAGRYVNQFNRDNPIHPYINTFMSLFTERNYMKIYEQDFVNLTYEKNWNEEVSLKLYSELSRRRQLYNNTDFTIFDWDGDHFTPNAPVNLELPDTSFPENNALIVGGDIEYKPFIKYSIYNGRKIEIKDSSPIFGVSYKKGISSVFNSDVDYDLLEVSYKDQYKIGIRGLVDVYLKAGTFLTSEKMYFTDYKHFLGGRTPFTTLDPVGSFRLLDYYAYSTNEEYFAGNLHYQFRQFLVTRIPIVRLSGVRENLFVNYLANDVSSNYTELGYGINYIFRVFRLEVVTAFKDGKYEDWGVRVGIASNLASIF
ncbi:DUF5686 and carboxypeptidase regulatory-like domain-containing protein [Fulvivirga maritima]|uniref:DUF5686 and carboxypeptidase regulatory-like domain-containing protein n=1 Tax=Fulvivirga maritima TaxID=2904247 RepID=UPI001F18EEEE|nr:DUF5686 and carboxypeptidase regulatory-like domain-containing protein [Fulvivirga maritima]UII28823.1 DUF5686 and carboxypeptidase regulatory-like domain-containing protein [Fulvivirga maritima]